MSKPLSNEVEKIVWSLILEDVRLRFENRDPDIDEMSYTINAKHLNQMSNLPTKSISHVVIQMLKKQGKAYDHKKAGKYTITISKKDVIPF